MMIDDTNFRINFAHVLASCPRYLYIYRRHFTDLCSGIMINLLIAALSSIRRCARINKMCKNIIGWAFWLAWTFSTLSTHIIVYVCTRLAARSMLLFAWTRVNFIIRSRRKFSSMVINFYLRCTLKIHGDLSARWRAPWNVIFYDAFPGAWNGKWNNFANGESRVINNN